MGRIVNWNDEPHEQLINQLCDELAMGGVVVVPTDTTYVAVGLLDHIDSVKKLRQLQESHYHDQPVLYVRDFHEGSEWLSSPSLVVNRLMRRCWPGPLTVVGNASEATNAGLPPDLAEFLIHDGGLAVRSPAHLLPLNLIVRTGQPLVGLPLQTSNGPVFDEISLESCDLTCCDFIIRDSQSHFQAPETVIRIEGDSYRLIREGVIGIPSLSSLSPCVILFVCTGNTCRSPMAEILCKKVLAQRLQCTPDQLSQKGYVVLSAGLAANPGSSANPNAMEAVGYHQMDLTMHRSQPITAELLRHADHVFTMTRSHRDALESAARGLPIPSLQLLSPDNEDIPDPIGGTAEVYQQCATQILRFLEQRIEEFQPL